MSITHDQVLSDLSRHQAATDRAEAADDAREAIIREEVERLTTTREGVDEVLECILTRLGENGTKAQFLDQLIGLLSVKNILRLSVREACLQSTLETVAEVLADNRADNKMKEIERENEAIRAGW